jgi:hypothetical protein
MISDSVVVKPARRVGFVGLSPDSVRAESAKTKISRKSRLRTYSLPHQKNGRTRIFNCVARLALGQTADK